MSCIPLQDFSLINLCDATKAGKLYSIVPDDGAGDLDVARATTATYLASDGLIKTAPINTPRIEFNPDGTYKGLLVEPAATNLLQRSEEFDNAYWAKINVTITANDGTAPDGTTTADKLIPSIVNTGHFLSSGTFSFTSGTTYTFSVFAKASGYNHLRLAFSPSAFPSDGRSASFNLATSTVGDTQSGVTARIQTLPNGFYRCSITATATVTSNSIGGFINSQNADSATTISFAGDGTSGALIWGAQLEQGTVATSYIPTVASTVTRAADVISKTGISSLIGQTEGTLFVEASVSIIQAQTITLSDDSLNNVVQITFNSNGSITLGVVVNGSIIVSEGSGASILTENTFFKIALKYSINSFSLFLNGNEVASSSSGITFPSETLDTLKLANGNGSTPFEGNIKALSILPTRLSNEQLAELTTI